MIQRIKSRLKIDKILLIAILSLLLLGIAIFLSASLGILSSNELKFYSIIKSQIAYVFIFGIFALYLGYIINYKYYKKFAIHIFILTFIFSFSTIVPGLSFEYNGAAR
jgi:cell division protein FtsW (lipid II flippase)